MQRKLVLVTIFSLVFASGIASADRGRRGGGHRDGHRGGPVVRDHRSAPGGVVVRDHRGPRHDNRFGGRHDRGHHRGHHKHVRVSGGRYVFPGGVVRVYKRPVIRERYYNRRVRPAIIVEHYDPVPGYVWVRGNWTWGGGEWIWTPGYWAVESAPVYVEPAPPPVVQGGISVSAGISVR
jgi:hypothetical protein